MTTTQFEPESWDRAGAAFEDEGAAFSSAFAATVGSCSIEALGCNNGGTIADTALGIVVPSLLQALQETVDGIAGGLTATAEGLRGTGSAYRQVEERNAEASAMLEEG